MSKTGRKAVICQCWVWSGGRAGGTGSAGNGLLALPVAGEAGLVCPSATIFPHVGSFLTLWSKLGVYPLDPRGANHPIHGLAALGRE